MPAFFYDLYFFPQELQNVKDYYALKSIKDEKKII